MIDEIQGYPPGLNKLIATRERGLIGLANGTVIAFKIIEGIDQIWVRAREPIKVESLDHVSFLKDKIVEPNWLNGVEIRVSDIAWIVRNPTVANTGTSGAS